MNNLVGQKIQNYRIEALLGQGGMGAVFRALDVNLARPVAIKVMHAQYASQSEFQQRFMQEARTIARLDHPAVVDVYNFDNRDGLVYLVMEYVPGLSLGVYIKRLARRRQVVLLPEALSLVAQVADALDYAHRQGVIHRDVKPDNILMKVSERPSSPPLRAIVTDFGLAKLLAGGVETKTGTLMGTLSYMSPEQVLDQSLDGRSDLYSLGVVLYQLATGRLPFEIKTPTDAVVKHMHETPPPPRQIQPGLPPMVAEIIEQAIARYPDDRFSSGQTMATALRRAMDRLTPQDVTQFVAASDSDVLSIVAELSPADSESATHPDPDAGENGRSHPRHDRLTYARDDDTPLTRLLDQPVLVIGRTEGNDLVLPGAEVSRQHARLERVENGWQVTDLESTNGTFLEDERLPSNTPRLWPSGTSLHIGPYELRWRRPPRPVESGSLPATALPAGGSQVQSADGRFSVVAAPINLALAPGDRAKIQVELYNDSAVDSRFHLEIEGLPVTWVMAPREPVAVAAGERSNCYIVVNPPRQSSTRAGQRQYRLVVKDVDDEATTAVLAGSIHIQPFTQFTCDMHPHQLTNAGLCRVLMRNLGNVETTFTVAAEGPDAINFDRNRAQVILEPGQTRPIDIELSAAERPLLGRRRTYPFTLQVGSDERDRQSLAGELNVRPVLPGWLMSIFAVLLLLICVAGAVTFAAINQRNREIAAVAAAATQTISARMTTAAEGTAVAQQTAATATALALTAEAQGDDDADGLSNQAERDRGLDPANPDSDGDGLSDGAEVNEHRTDPLQADTDGDGLSDGDEVNQHQTNPLEPDSDGDGVSDGDEVAAGTDPLRLPTPTPTPTATFTPTATPSATPTATITPTPSATPTLPPAQGVWQGTWASECEALTCGTVALNHVAGETTVSGTFRDGEGDIVGIVTNNRLSGTWSLGGDTGAIDFWLAPDGQSWQGNWNKTAAWCGYRPEQAPPQPCGVASWYGEWQTDCGDTDCGVLNILQDGAEVAGTFAGGQGSISGAVDGTTLTGQWSRNNNSGSLQFFMLNMTQFNGNYNAEFAWCGHRAGSALSDPCLNLGDAATPTPTPEN